MQRSIGNVSSSSIDQLVSRLRSALGADEVVVDAASRHDYANDIFWQPGITPEAIVRPSMPQHAADAIRLICEAGFAVVPRGGACRIPRGVCRPSLAASWLMRRG